MIMLLKRIAAQFPDSMQHELRRLFFHSQIRGHRFATDEKEYALLDTLLAPGDWAQVKVFRSDTHDLFARAVASRRLAA